MSNFTIYDGTGRVIRSGWVQDGNEQLQVGDGESILVGVRADYETQRVENGELVPIPVIPPTLAELKADAKVAVAARRWEIETGGTVVGGIALATDDRSKLLLSAAAEKARLDATFVTRWKTDAGWVTVDAPTLLALHGAVFAHVAGCFAREEALCVLIDEAADEAAVSALAPVVVAFWPS